jgi:hypothetical protein
MIQVCCYKGCGAVYGAKEPLSDKNTTHGLCPKHLKITLKRIKIEMEKRKEKLHEIQHEGPGKRQVSQSKG